MNYVRHLRLSAGACGVALTAGYHSAGYAACSATTCPPTSCVMVDAGSGWTRVERFSRHAEDGLVHIDATKRLPPLADVLVAGGDEPARWLSSLAAVVDGDSKEAGSGAGAARARASGVACPPQQLVYIGATAGLRNALQKGVVTHRQLAEFEELARGALGERARFAVVSGETEAAMELRAVEYCARRSGALGDDGGGTPLGLMSSGGMSSQLVFSPPRLARDSGSDGGGGGTRALSLPTSLKQEGNRRCLQEGLEPGLAAYDSYLHGIVASASARLGSAAGGQREPTGAGAGLRGTFVMIEVLGSVGERAGIARRVMSARAATEALDAYLARWRQAAASETAADVAQRTWKSVVPATSALQARRLLQLLHPEEARVYFSRTFEIAEGHVLKPSWTLGYALTVLETDHDAG
eukprot:g6519.t1